jgi:hypothetical protein
MHIYFNNILWFVKCIGVVAFLNITVQSPNALTQIFHAPQQWQPRLTYEFFSYFLTENLLLETIGIRPYRKLLVKGNEELHLVRCPKIRLCMFIEVLCFVKNHENVFHYILYCYWGQSSLCTTMVALYTPPNFLLVLIVHRRLCDSGIADHRSQQLCIWISQANMKLEAPILHNIFLIQNFVEM